MPLGKDMKPQPPIQAYKDSSKGGGQNEQWGNECRGKTEAEPPAQFNLWTKIEAATNRLQIFVALT